MVNKECLLKKTLLSFNFSGFKDFKITEMLNAVVSSRIQLHRGSILNHQRIVVCPFLFWQLYLLLQITPLVSSYFSCGCMILPL
jgi:hypothetical protein